MWQDIFHTVSRATRWCTDPVRDTLIERAENSSLLRRSHVYPRRPQIFENMRILSRAITVVAAARRRRSEGEARICFRLIQVGGSPRMRHYVISRRLLPRTAAECAIQNPGSDARANNGTPRIIIPRTPGAIPSRACPFFILFRSIASETDYYRYRERSDRSARARVLHPPLSPPTRYLSCRSPNVYERAHVAREQSRGDKPDDD